MSEVLGNIPESPARQELLQMLASQGPEGLQHVGAEVYTTPQVAEEPYLQHALRALAQLMARREGIGI